MLNNPAAVRSLRAWRRLVVATAMVLCTGLAAGALQALRTWQGAATLVEQCRVEALKPPAGSSAQLRLGGICLAAFAWSHDAATGARAARALARASGHAWLVEWLASDIGDSAEGADAWLAAGVSRLQGDEVQEGVVALQRAQAHRAATDIGGRLHDATSLMIAYRDLGDLQRAAHFGADAYTLATAVTKADRSTTLVNLAELLRRLGSLEVTRRLLAEAAEITGPDDRGYTLLQQLQGLVEQALHHPHMARNAFLAARASAARAGSSEWAIHLDMLDLAIEQGELDEAVALSAHSPPIPDDAWARAAAAYYTAQLEVARGRFDAAARRSEQALLQAPPDWAMSLEATRGYALLRAGALGDAEPALLRAVRRLEEQRNALDHDTFKSWSLARRRTAFEDLFLLYTQQDRLEEALHIAQRATARSLLDELLAPPLPSGALPTDIEMIGTHAAGLRTLARSLRASPSADVPSITRIVQRLHGRHVVTFFRVRKDLWAIAIRRDSTLIARRIGDADELDRSLDTWRDHPENGGLAEELGMRLLPDELMPAAGDTLYVVVDGPVADVTFASLRRHDAYVVERNPVAYAPSAAALSVAAAPAGRSQAVVIGDPMGNLPAARLEAIDVGRMLGVQPFVGGAATRAVLHMASDAELLHVAAHTDSTANGPAIHLADAPLEAATVLEQRLTTKLVVLLGCSSARAKERDELAPLAAAFIAAGAHTVVASLWAVDDAVGRRFAHEFYLAGGRHDPIRALADAQRQLIRDGARVEQWSTFVVLGGPSETISGTSL